MSQRGQVGGYSDCITASLTRPANTTQYASGDLIANSATASAVTPLTFNAAARYSGGSFFVRRARLTKSADSTTAAKFRLHLFDADPTATDPTNGDNGAIQLTGALSHHLGSIDFTTIDADIHTDGNVLVAGPMQGSEITARLGSGQAIYGLLEARDTYTPASGEVFSVTLEIIQN